MPFSYLANKYKDDVAIVWIDAHKDLNLQGDSYEGYHAMALAATFGLIDKEGIARFYPLILILKILSSLDCETLKVRKKG